jgi:4-hydroxybenzoate polyprenyltransferase
MSKLGVLTLIRPPNVFTAFADSLAGLLVLIGVGVTVPHHAWVIVLASGALYLAGIVFNDVFDRHVDARERPMRPIPSGLVSLRTAVGLGAVLMLAGLAIALFVGLAPGLLAFALAVCILFYDAGAKSTQLGPIVMGACRGLNMALGLSTGLTLGTPWPAIAIGGPIVLALYVAGLTHLARDEVSGNTARRARVGVAVLAAVAVGAVTAILATPGLPRSPWAWAWVALTLVLGYRNWQPIWHRHDSAATGRAVGGGITMIPVLDATVCAVAGMPLWAVAVAALTVPAFLLKRHFSPT